MDVIGTRSFGAFSISASRRFSGPRAAGATAVAVVFLNVALAACGPPTMTLARVPVRYPNGQIGYELRPVPITQQARPAAADQAYRPARVSTRSSGCDSSSGRDECKDNNADRAAAERGDVGAQMRLAWYYRSYETRQLDAVTDSAESMRWYQKAAAQGNLYAKYQIGVLYKKGGWGFTRDQGEGVQQDYAEALRWFHMVADQPVKVDGLFNYLAAAQYEIGDCYEGGLGVQQSHAEAMKWFRIAASGNGQARSIVQREDATKAQAEADAKAAAVKQQQEAAQARQLAPIVAAGQREHERLEKAVAVNDSESPRPDHNHALAQINDTLQGDGWVITDMQYENGAADGQHYIVLASWIRTFTKSYRELVSDQSKDAALVTVLATMFGAMPNYGDAKAGDQFRENKQFTFIQTENGWMLSQ